MLHRKTENDYKYRTNGTSANIGTAKGRQTPSRKDHKKKCDEQPSQGVDRTRITATDGRTSRAAANGTAPIPHCPVPRPTTVSLKQAV